MACNHIAARVPPHVLHGATDCHKLLSCAHSNLQAAALPCPCSKMSPLQLPVSKATFTTHHSCLHSKLSLLGTQPLKTQLTNSYKGPCP